MLGNKHEITKVVSLVILGGKSTKNIQFPSSFSIDRLYKVLPTLLSERDLGGLNKSGTPIV